MIGVGPVVGSALAIGAFLVPVARHRSQQLSIQSARRQSVPELVDLFRLAVGAGRSVHQVVDVVEPYAPEVFASTLTEVRRRVALGQRFGDALDAFDELGEPVRPLVASLRAAAFDGVALGPALERVAVDARLQRPKTPSATSLSTCSLHSPSVWAVSDRPFSDDLAQLSSLVAVPLPPSTSRDRRSLYEQFHQSFTSCHQ